MEEKVKGAKKMQSGQTEMVSIEQLVAEKHTYRRLKQLLNFDDIVKAAKLPKSDVGAIGYERERLTLYSVVFNSRRLLALNPA